MRDVEMSKMEDKNGNASLVSSLMSKKSKKSERKAWALETGAKKYGTYTATYFCSVHQGITLFHHKLLRLILLPCDMPIFDLHM